MAEVAGPEVNGRATYLDTADGNYYFRDTRERIGSYDDLIALQNQEDTDPVFDPTGENNDEFFDSISDTGTFFDNLGSAVLSDLASAGAAAGHSRYSVAQTFSSRWNNNGVLRYLNGFLTRAEEQKKNWQDAVRLSGGRLSFGDGTGMQRLGGEYFLKTVEGFNQLKEAAVQWYSNVLPFNAGGGSFRGGGGGGGRRSLTPDEIKKQFDLDELAERATEIWRGILLTDDFDARGMARAYVDAVIAGKGEQRIDFDTFIRNKARETDRHASIYKNFKPGALSEEQYLQPFYAAAQQVLRPENAADVAIGGAQFGADSATFGARLRRSEEATSSAPFIGELETRLTDLNNLFKGT